MVRDSVAYLKAAGRDGLLRRRALLRRLHGATPPTRSRSAARPPRPAPTRSCSATRTAARCRTTSRASPSRSIDALPRRRRSASTPTTTPGARSRTRSWPSTAGCTHVQGTMNGYGERAGNADLTAIIPALVLKMGDDVRHRRPAAAAHRGQPLRRRDRERLARPAPARTWARARSRTRAACTRARRRGCPRPTSTSTRARSATSRASS